MPSYFNPRDTLSRAEIARRLRAAAGYFAILGWTQGRTIDPNTGGVCGLGALGLASGVPVSQFLPSREFHLGWSPEPSERDVQPEYAQLQLACHRYLGVPLHGYNDEPGRTSSEVIAKLLEIADIYDPLHLVEQQQQQQQPALVSVG